MSSSTSSIKDSLTFLHTVLDVSSSRSNLTSDDPSRPYVTLTFAQSLDGKIAGKGGKQLILSGKESMLMTHWMRTMHDAILIGIGTALNDDPQLNIRHLPSRAPTEDRHHLPRPVILDSRCRLKHDCKLLQNYRSGNGRRPWVICSPSASSSNREALERAGAKVIQVEAVASKLCIQAVMKALRGLDIQSLMVEGGASVIGSFLAETPASIVDSIIVTVAPTFVGDDGIGYGIGLRGDQIPRLQHIKTELMGQDTVVAVKPRLLQRGQD